MLEKYLTRSEDSEGGVASRLLLLLEEVLLSWELLLVVGEGIDQDISTLEQGGLGLGEDVAGVALSVASH